MKEKLYNLTNPQKSIWLTEQYYKGTPIENITGTVIIPKKVNFKILEQAINFFVEKNDSFRLKFIIKDNNVQQYVEQYKKFSLDIINVSGEDELKKVSKSIAETIFNINNSFLYIFKLIKFPDNHGGFIINMHHLISDAWTAGNGATEIIKIYNMLLKKEDISNIAYPSYIEYINSEQEYINSPKYSLDKEFWNNMFNSVPEVATIPGTQKDNASLSSKSNRKQFQISKETVNNLNDFCKKNGFSMFNFFMSVLAVYLGRVSNLDEFVIGTPILNRTNAKEKQTSGMFISAVPLKINLSTNIKFTELASNISSSFFSIFKHKKYSYVSLLEDLRKKESSLPNLYNIVLSYQNIRSSANTSEIPYSINWIPANVISDDIDIHIYDMNDTGNINIAYDYKTSKYVEKDIVDTHNRILNIINQILSNQNMCLCDIEIVTPEEKNKILYNFNNTEMDYPKDKTIVQLFEDQVEKIPNQIALVYKNESLTYKELNEKANSLANYLIEQKLEKGDIIGIYQNKNINYVISVLATLKAGLVFLPISTLHPKDRIEYILDNSKTKLIISTEHLINANKLSCEYINIESFKFIKNTVLEYQCFPNDTAYILYTSGSTGKPKGIKIANYSIVNHVYGINNKFDNSISNNDICLSVANISFDAHIQELFIPLAFGASLHLLNDDALYDVKFLADYIVKNKITFSFLPPNILDQISEYFNKNTNILCLNKLLVGVESIKYSTLNKFIELNNDIKIHNGYGPTEATICCISYMYNKNNQINSNSILPIGRPLGNTYIAIINPNYETLQPIGIPGEIIIGGDCVSFGYVDETLNNVFSYNKDFNKRCYHTGDFAYYLPDGNIQFIGRKDSQIKVSGHRIELGEIEKCIYEYSSIEKAVVQLNNLNKIVAYFTASKKIDLVELKKFLQKKLPAYFLPNFLIQIDKFELTVNGKINYKALNKIEITDLAEYIAPSTNFEKKLISLCESTLGLKKISMKSNFFDIGGDSLSAINLCSSIYAELKIQVSANDIFEHPIISDFSDFILSKTKNTNTIEIIKAPELKEYPASYAQKRIYYASIMSGNNSTLYNTPGGLLLTEMPDINKLENCFKEIIQRHETLRTSFELNGENLVQKINEKFNFKIEYKNTPIIENEISTNFANFVKPFDLSCAPLIRASLYKISSSDKFKAILFIDLHHIICDGTSLNVLINELCKLYNGEKLAPLSISYKDFAWTENKLSESAEFKEAENYWLSQFSNELPVLEIPTNHSRPAIKSYKGKTLSTVLDENIVHKINDKSKELGITPYMLTLSAYYILLYNYTMKEDIIIGSPIAAREFAETNNLVGMFVNTLVFRTKIDPNITIKEFFNKIKELCLNNYKYQTYPFDELVNKLKIKRNPSRNPLFDTLFTFQNTRKNGKINLGTIEGQIYREDTNISKFDLSIEIMPNDNTYNINFEYCDKLFDEEFILNLENHYINIIKEILDNLDNKISGINMLSEEEEHKILYEFNNTQVDYHKNKTISQLFEEQVEKTPNNIALVFEDESLTYKELNEKANSLANYLRTNGIERNDFVGIMVNRSLEMIISILAVLKAGGTYIPIDPEYPKDRVEYMLNNSKAKLLLTFSKLQYNVNFENMIFVELSNSEIYSLDNKNLENVNEPNDSSYIIYTSGSTGLPKGVVLTHKALSNLTNYSNNYIEYLKNNEYRTIVSVTTVSFDIFIFETLISLQRGLKLIIANDDEKTMPIFLNKLIEKHNVTIIQTTPSRMQFWIDNYTNIPNLAKLKFITLAGEPLPLSLAQKLKSISDITIYNGYGPSETTVFSTLTDVTDKENITIGKPLDNTKIYILDDNLHPVPIGIIGELYIAGDGLGKGYLNNKELTDKSFIKNPFITNTLMYKTGDIGYFKTDGEIICLGRNDTQVKIRGLRIELGEIESCICSYPNIEKSVVVVNSEQQILAFYKSTENTNKNDLKAYLQRKLPTYFIPNFFIQIDKFPMTPNGKIDKKVLRAKIFEAENNYEAPHNEYQEKLVNLFKIILNKEKIGINDNFFELGGDSLSAIKLQIEAFNIGFDLPYKDIFNYPTVKQLSEKITVATETSIKDNYDYTKINKLLSQNKKFNNYIIRKDNIKNILLTGSTGFVGSHILENLLKHTKCNIYCLIRRKNNTDPQKRLLDILHFYFGNKYDKYIFKRIFAIEGNITRKKLGLNNTYYNELGKEIDCIINAAALVKHYGKADVFKETNIDGVNNLINFSKDFNCKLIHLSTLSVSGNIFETSSYMSSDNNAIFSEQNLYIGQDLSNMYVYTKFMAERIILENIITNNLNAKIIRLGNITNRYSDGLFQINMSENAFLNRIHSFLQIGYLPDYILNNYIEFTPVDICADAIVKISIYKNPYTVFHVYNNNFITFKELIKTLKSLGININIVDKSKFNRIVQDLSNDEQTKNKLSGIINDFNNKRILQYSTNIQEKNVTTTNFLKNLFFKWPKINTKYIVKYIAYLKAIGYIK